MRTRVAAILLAIASISIARADAVLDRAVSFHISPGPLGHALIEFSSQSHVQVAAADADVSHANSQGVTGTLPIGAALRALLAGTGLDYSMVGNETIAIQAAPTGSTLAGSLAARTDTAAATAAFPDVAVQAPGLPAAAQLAGGSIHQFVVHHSSVHYANYGTGNLAHWRGGKQSICPRTVGIGTAADAYVTARIRAVAAYVGAPVDADPQCKDNVRVIFTTSAETAMNDVVTWASVYFERGGRYQAMRRLIAFKSGPAVQGWYFTTHRGSAVLNSDLKLLNFSLNPVWPQITPNYVSDIGDMSGIGAVMLVIDRTKVADDSIGVIADYAAMLTLSVVQTPDHCDPLPSILDAMSSQCGTRAKPSGMTAGDLAFLRALYYRNTAFDASPTRIEVEHSMSRDLKGGL